MNLVEELRKLQSLHFDGALSDDEFAKAKARLLEGVPPADRPSDSELARQLEDIKIEHALLRLDREWEQESQTYLISDGEGRRHLPTRAGGLVMAVMAVGFGLVWTVSTMSMPHFGGGWDFFPCFGVLFILLGLAFSFHSFSRAEAYEKAEAEYRRKRAELESRRRA
jgi:hypothetical protein